MKKTGLVPTYLSALLPIVMFGCTTTQSATPFTEAGEQLTTCDNLLLEIAKIEEVEYQFDAAEKLDTKSVSDASRLPFLRNERAAFQELKQEIRALQIAKGCIN